MLIVMKPNSTPQQIENCPYPGTRTGLAFIFTGLRPPSIGAIGETMIPTDASRCWMESI